ncbi:MAG: pilus assembly protein TadG-related protein, partial [Desulfuromonadales bacterium]
MYKLKEQKGAFAPFVAVLIVLLILAVGLVVDLGHIHNVRTELQRAVDAAALAGAGQLTGDDEQESRAIAAAEAMAEENNVDAEKVSVIDDNVLPTVGSWDDEALGASAEERYEEDGDPVNAIRVEATRQVDHWFFFPIPGTEVTANAIAVNAFEEESIPIALVSC